MTWFFAILVVAVMGGVAVVAVGHGASMSEAYDDRPDSRVPADGPLRSEDLRGVRFSTAFRGYRMSEVDALLDRLAAELEPPRPDRDSSGAPAAEDPVGGGPVEENPVEGSRVEKSPVDEDSTDNGPAGSSPAVESVHLGRPAHPAGPAPSDGEA